MKGHYKLFGYFASENQNVGKNGYKLFSGTKLAAQANCAYFCAVKPNNERTRQ